MKNYNVNHPEKKKMEIFLLNADRDFFTRMDWETKRLGKRAYYKTTGKPIPDSNQHPIFVRRRELEKKAVEWQEKWAASRHAQ